MIENQGSLLSQGLISLSISRTNSIACRLKSLSTLPDQSTRTAKCRSLFNDLTEISSTNIENESDSRPQFDSERVLSFGKIRIDEKDDLEFRIHEWLDKENIRITDPNEKLADFYHSARLAAFQKGFESLSDSNATTTTQDAASQSSKSFVNSKLMNGFEEDALMMLPSLKLTPSLKSKKQSSVLMLSSSPILLRRTTKNASESCPNSVFCQPFSLDNSDSSVQQTVTESSDAATTINMTLTISSNNNNNSTNEQETTNANNDTITQNPFISQPTHA